MVAKSDLILNLRASTQMNSNRAHRRSVEGATLFEKRATTSRLFPRLGIAESVNIAQFFFANSMIITEQPIGHEQFFFGQSGCVKICAKNCKIHCVCHFLVITGLYDSNSVGETKGERIVGRATQRMLSRSYLLDRIH